MIPQSFSLGQKNNLYIAQFSPFILIPLPSSTCHRFHVPDVVGEWNRHHGNIYSDDAVFQESPQPCTSQSLHYTGYPRGCGQTFVLCVAGIRYRCHRIWKRVYTVSCINNISDLIPTKLSRGTDSSSGRSVSKRQKWMIFLSDRLVIDLKSLMIAFSFVFHIEMKSNLNPDNQHWPVIEYQ